MARIRSVHPGQWKDGEFLECSPFARLLALALRNLADDHGVFRWKPKTIKVECLPADNCDIDALLAELVASNQIEKYEVEGKEYGIIRDFSQWQRPKKPTYVHPLPNQSSTSSVPVENHSTTTSEIPPQRKEEGGSRERDSAALISQAAFELSDSVISAVGGDREEPRWAGFPYLTSTWLTSGIPKDFALSKAAAISKNKPQSYFDKAVRNAWAERQAEPKIEGKPNGNYGIQAAGSVVAAADRLVAKVAEFDKPAPICPDLPAFLDRRGELRERASEDDVRLLSKG